MKRDVLEILACPKCHARFTVSAGQEDSREIRNGRLTCSGNPPHTFEIQEGIIKFAAGFDHEAVQKELNYENTTYKGDKRLTDKAWIAKFPDTLQEVWPHIRNFGPDFRDLIERLRPKASSWVLDIGTGPCWTSRLLAQAPCRVIALDVNEADYYGLKTSDIHFSAHGVYFERILESMTHLPFADATIDAITFNASLHHTPDLDRTLKECHRVLQPGGVAAMVNEEFASLRHAVFPKGESTDTGSHHTIPYADFERAARNAGFRIEYKLVRHVRDRINERLGLAAPAAVMAFETFPFLIQQLNSALIFLRK